MSQDKKDHRASITDKKQAGCFFTSFCSSGRADRTTPPPQKGLPETSSKALTDAPEGSTPKSSFVSQNGLPLSKILIMGDFIPSNRRKEDYLSSIQWRKLPHEGASKFFSEKTADQQLIMHDITECDKNSFPVILRTATFVTLIPSSARDLSVCCHAVFDKQDLLSADCRVVYLNLAEPNSLEYSAIEAEAKKWIAKHVKLSAVEAPSVQGLVEKALTHTKTVYNELGKGQIGPLK